MAAFLAPHVRDRKPPQLGIEKSEKLVDRGFAPAARAIDQQPQFVNGRLKLLLHHASE